MRKIVISLLFGLVFSMALLVYADTTQKHIASSVVRLHIVANSDSERDQSVKLKVRDAVLEEFSEVLSAAENRMEAECIIDENIEKISAAADRVLRENGCEYGAAAFCGEVHFPVKSYENITLPPGSYESLQIVLGAGAGQNWWCVMYPPLCFDGSVSGYAGTDSGAALKNSLDESEYELITKTDGELPVQFKFKILEIFDKINKK